MPLRFIDTEFFKHPFIRGLKSPHKLLYTFILCDCDNAGIWSPEFEVAAIYTDQKQDRETAKKIFKDKFIELNNGKWFFPDFIQWQYPTGLSEKNPAHTKIINTLKRFDLIDSDLKVKLPNATPRRGHEVPPMGTKVVVEDKDKDKGGVEDKDKGGAVKAELIHPLQKYITENLPTVAKLKDQLTYPQCLRLVEEYPKDKIKEVLDAMENYKPLLGRYKSVNLTIQNWIKKRIEDESGQKTTSAGKRPKGFHTDQELHEAALRIVGNK